MNGGFFYASHVELDVDSVNLLVNLSLSLEVDLGLSLRPAVVLISISRVGGGNQRGCRVPPSCPVGLLVGLGLSLRAARFIWHLPRWRRQPEGPPRPLWTPPVCPGKRKPLFTPSGNPNQARRNILFRRALPATSLSRLRFAYLPGCPIRLMGRQSRDLCSSCSFPPLSWDSPIRSVKMPGRRGKEPESDQAGAGKPRRGR